MSADHKRPLLAFVLVTIACLLIVVNAARSEALRSALHHGADRVAAGVRLALEDDPAPVEATVPRSFDRDDERAVASRRPPAATMLLPGPSVTVPSVSAASLVARQHTVPAPRHRALSRHDHATSRPQHGRPAQRSARAGHQRAAAAEHGVRKAQRAAHPRTTSGHATRAHTVVPGPARVVQHRPPARATSAHRTSSRHHHARDRAHHRSHHGGRHPRR